MIVWLIYQLIILVLAIRPSVFPTFKRRILCILKNMGFLDIHYVMGLDSPGSNHSPAQRPWLPWVSLSGGGGGGLKRVTARLASPWRALHLWSTLADLSGQSLADSQPTSPLPSASCPVLYLVWTLPPTCPRPTDPSQQLHLEWALALAHAHQPQSPVQDPSREQTCGRALWWGMSQFGRFLETQGFQVLGIMGFKGVGSCWTSPLSLLMAFLYQRCFLKPQTFRA